MTDLDRNMIRQLACLATASVLLISSGCGGSYSGPSEYEQQKQGEQSFAELIAAAGGNAEKKQFKMGGVDQMAWNIDLSGATISDEIVEAIVKRIETEYIAELNFSGTTLTDGQFAKLEAGKFARSAIKLDLSKTGITDTSIDQLENAPLLMELNLSGTSVSQQAADGFKTRLAKKRAESGDPRAKLLGTVKIQM